MLGETSSSQDNLIKRGAAAGPHTGSAHAPGYSQLCYPRSMGGSADDGQRPWASCPFLTAHGEAASPAVLRSALEMDAIRPANRADMSLYSEGISRGIRNCPQ